MSSPLCDCGHEIDDHMAQRPAWCTVEQCFCKQYRPKYEDLLVKPESPPRCSCRPWFEEDGYLPSLSCPYHGI